MWTADRAAAPRGTDGGAQCAAPMAAIRGAWIMHRCVPWCPHNPAPRKKPTRPSAHRLGVQILAAFLHCWRGLECKGDGSRPDGFQMRTEAWRRCRPAGGGRRDALHHAGDLGRRRSEPALIYAFVASSAVGARSAAAPGALRAKPSRFHKRPLCSCSPRGPRDPPLRRHGRLPHDG